ncbi:unnamed protein product [Penicillium roqueforti FM164]|uniref:Uncharacterized protein n=1 Tax=Penicillium roqueforti (strain FM164) TaxID=1365484 RepID=W6R6E7_PENRF|nr:unnamed protein product [Penicillium roqueforti FM164]
MQGNIAQSESAKADAMLPTYTPTWVDSTSGNVEAMSGRYGLIEFNAVCSASAIIASTAICLFGSGDAFGGGIAISLWVSCEPSPEDSDWPELGRPRDLGGGVSKVW